MSRCGEKRRVRTSPRHALRAFIVAEREGAGLWAWRSGEGTRRAADCRGRARSRREGATE
jgi:hypothetical protein